MALGYSLSYYSGLYYSMLEYYLWYERLRAATDPVNAWGQLPTPEDSVGPWGQHRPLSFSPLSENYKTIMGKITQILNIKKGPLESVQWPFLACIKSSTRKAQQAYCHCLCAWNLRLPNQLIRQLDLPWNGPEFSLKLPSNHFLKNSKSRKQDWSTQFSLCAPYGKSALCFCVRGRRKQCPYVWDW